MLQKTTSDLKISYLTRRLEEAGLCVDNTADDSTIHTNKNERLDESEAILVIKELQEKVYSVRKSFDIAFFGDEAKLVSAAHVYVYLCFSCRLTCLRWISLQASKIWMTLFS